MAASNLNSKGGIPCKKAKLSSTDKAMETDSDITVKQFISLLKDPPTTLEALRAFIKQSKKWPESTDVDLVSDFCSAHGECSEIIQLLEEGNRKVHELALVMEALECILLRIAGDLTKYTQTAITIVTTVLANHMSSVYKLLHIKNKSSQIKVAIKLLIVMANQGKWSAAKVQHEFDFDHEILPPLLQRTNTKDPEDVRACLLKFLVGFLESDDNHVIKQAMQSKSLYQTMFQGIIYDKLETLRLILPALLANIVQNQAINKTDKIHFFKESTLKHLTELYKWKGPQGRSSQHDEGTSEAEIERPEITINELCEVQVMVHNLLHELCCSTKHGIIFWDKSLAISGKNQNHILTAVLRSIHEPHLQSFSKYLVLQILRVCPDQIHWFLPHFQSSLAPKMSYSWIKCMEFITQVYQNQLPVFNLLTSQTSLPCHKLASIAVNGLFPPKEVWSNILFSLKKDQRLMSYLGLKTVKVVLERVVDTMMLCEKNASTFPAQFLTGLTEKISKLIPTTHTLSNCMMKVMRETELSPKKKKMKVETKDENNDMLADIPVVSYLLEVFNILCLYQKHFPEMLQDGTVDYSLALNGINKAYNTREEAATLSPVSVNQMDELQLYALKFLAGTDVRQFNWTKESVGGQTTLYLLLEMVATTATNKTTNFAIKDLVHMLLLRTGYFVGSEHEIDIWLDILSMSEASSHSKILQFLDRSLCHLIRRPYNYFLKMEDNSREIDGVNTGKDVCSIDEILAMDEVLLSDETELSSNSHKATTSLGFSPLVLATMDTAHMHNLEDTQTLKYLQIVLESILHCQFDPVSLCQLMKNHPLYPHITCLHSSIQRWAPHEEGMELTEKGSSVLKTSVGSHNAVSKILQECFEQGHNIHNEDITVVVSEITKPENLKDSVIIVRQLLLYIRTSVMEYLKKSDNSLDSVQFYGDILCDLVSHMVSEISRLDRPHTSETENQVASETHAKKMFDCLKNVCIVILDHSIFKEYFLVVAKPRSKSSRKGHVSKVLSPLISAVVDLICPSMAAEMENYVHPYCKIMETYILKGKCLEVWKVMAPKGFIKWLSETCLMHLLDDLTNKEKEESTEETVDGMHTKCKLVSQILLQLEEKDVKSMPPETFRNVVSYVSESNNDDLSGALSTIMNKYQLCAMFLDRTTFEQVLKAQLTFLKKVMPEILANNTNCSIWYEEWLSQQNFSKKKKLGILAGPVLSYLDNTILVPEHILDMLRNAYWQNLSEWITKNITIKDEEQEKISYGLLTALIHHCSDDLILFEMWHKMNECSAETIEDTSHLKHQLNIMKLLVEKTSAMQNHLATTENRSNLAEHTFMHLMKQLNWLILETISNKSEFVCHIIELLLVFAKKLKKNHDILLGSVWETCLENGFKLLGLNTDFLKLVNQVCHHKCLSQGGENVPSHKLVFNYLIKHQDLIATLQLDHSSVTKTGVIDLWMNLIDMDPSLYDIAHIPLVLCAYRATLHDTDQKLFIMLRKYEAAGCKLTPVCMWGPESCAVNSSSSLTSLSRTPTAEQILGLLDKQMIQESSLKFPLNRKSQEIIQEFPSIEDTKATVYDPNFLLPLLCQMMGPENQMNCRSFIELGCLGYVLITLSCHDSMLRAIAYCTLERFYNQTEGTPKFGEKHQVLCLLKTLQNAVKSKNMKFPFIITLFWAEVASLSLNPEKPLYQNVNSVLLQKSRMDMGNVPDFYGFFNSSESEYKAERAWILTLLQNGIREVQDYHLCLKRNVFKILMTYYGSALSDQHTQIQVLSVIEKASAVKKICPKLVEDQSLLQWLTGMMRDGRNEPRKSHSLANILENIWTCYVDKYQPVADAPGKLSPNIVGMKCSNYNILQKLDVLLSQMSINDD